MQISLDENELAVWVIESPRRMRQYVTELRNQSEGKMGNFVLSDNGKEISLDKKMEVLFTPFDVVLNDKKCWNKVSGELKNMALDESQLCTDTTAVCGNSTIFSIFGTGQ